MTKVATALGLVAALAVPAQAATDAGHVSSKARKNKAMRCGGKWDAAATCTFKYAGGGLYAGGTYKAEQIGFISVTIEAAGPVEGTRIPILSCGTSAGAFGGCGSASTDSPTIELEKGQQLFCTGTGADRGKYSCRSTAN